MNELPLAPALQALIDRQQIHDCILRYCSGIDRFDREMVLSVYHADAIDDHGAFVGSAAQFVDWAIAYHRKYQHTHKHYVMNHRCELDGDSAHAETYWLFSGHNTLGPPASLHGGRYLDRFEKRDGVWAIAYRELLREWANLDEIPDMSDLSSFTSTRAVLSPEMRAFMNGGPASRRDRGDRSYARPLVGNPERVQAYRKLKD